MTHPGGYGGPPPIPRPRTPSELWNICYHVFGVAIPKVAVCRGHSSPFDAFCDSFFAHDSIVVWHAARGFGGKSMLLALLGLVEAVTLGASVSILGGSGEQSQRVHAYLAGTDPSLRGKFWEAAAAPRYMLKSDPTKRETTLTNGGRLACLMASQTSIRGAHPQRLRWDEVDESSIELYDASMGQTMGTEGVAAQTTISSTWHHPDGVMAEVLRRAAERGSKVHRWCYRETSAPHGWLKPTEIERKRSEVTSAMWHIEFDLFEPMAEGRAIDSAAVDAAFDPAFGSFRGAPDEEVVLYPPDVDIEHYHGTDWAKASDWTVIQTMRRGGGTGGTPDVLAAWKRTGRRPWPQMIAMHNARVAAYGGSSCHDATGVGEVCADYLEVDSEGFDFRMAKQRAELISNYVAAIERGDMVYPRIAWMYDEHRYATWNDLYGSGHLPDSMSAGALAWRARALADGREIFVGRVELI